MNDTKILVVLPAYNESKNIAAMVEELKRLDFSFDMVVIDDGSADATSAEALAAGANVITLPFNLGIGGAVQTGFLYALSKGYDVAAQVDGDGQHNAQYLSAILKPVLEGKADISVGSRFMAEDVTPEGIPGGGRPPSWRSSPVRRIGIRFFAWLISALTGYAVTDPTSGFRAINAKVIKKFAADYPQDFPEPESIMSAKRFGFCFIEVPVQMRKRIHGHSSIRYLKTLYYLIKVTIAILLNMLKSNKM